MISFSILRKQNRLFCGILLLSGFGVSLHWGCGVADAAQARDLRYRVGLYEVSIPALETKGGSLSDSELQAILGGDSKQSYSERFAKLNVDSIEVPEAVLQVNGGGVESRVVYRNLKLQGVRAGVVSLASAAGASGWVKTPVANAEAEEMKVEYRAVSVRNLNLPLILRFLWEPRADAAEPLASAYEEFTSDGYEMSGKTLDMSIGRIRGSGVRIRALARPYADLMNLLREMAPKAPAPAAGASGGVPQPAKADPEQLKVLVPQLADLLESLELSEMEASDLRVQPHNPPGMQPVSIGRIAMSGFSRSKVGEFAYEKFAFGAPGVAVKIGRLAFRDLEMQRTMQALVSAMLAGDTNLQGAKLRELLPSLGQVELRDVDIEVPAPAEQGSPDAGKLNRYGVKGFEIRAGDYLDGVPTALTVDLRNLVVPVPKDSASPNLQMFVDLGLTRMDLSAVVDLAWAADSSELRVKQVGVRMADLGDVRLGGVIGNVSKGLFSGDPEESRDSILRGLLRSLELDVENRGFYERFVQMQARKSGQSPAQVQQMMGLGAALGLPAALGTGPSAQAVSNAVVQFLKAPKKLRLSATAKEDLIIQDLSAAPNPNLLFQKMDVKAQAAP